MSMIEFADFVGIDKMTVVSLESGRRTKPKTPAKITAAFAPYVEFVEPVDGIRGPGLILKPGFEAAIRGATQGTDASQDASKGGLDALGWDWDEASNGSNVSTLTGRFQENLDEDDGPLPPLEWTDEEKAEQIEYWRSQPERWERLAEVSQLCLLRQMGISSLDSAP